ncbi:hypothetical protein [Brucella sp. NBRC 12950]|uniref:hypothetical protein n=1 Tax=Brucella sp. NBRC 12950 TaxID=2994518 RepID=UPI00255603DC|nr:hypothetical protein [Brucella sp. NBRC 12950]
MPLFNSSSHVYSSDEVEALRRCFSNAAIMLNEKGRDYSDADLAQAIIKLFDSGLRDLDQLSELAARLIDLDTKNDVTVAETIVANRKSPP